MTARSLLCGGSEAVTAEWMQMALTAGAAFGSPQIEAIAVDNLGAATNAFGTLLRCRLTVGDGSCPMPETVIVKLPGTDRKALKFARWLALHKREYEYYRQVAQHAPMRSPSLLYGEFDDRSHRFVLVLEDLRGMETIPQTIGLEPGHAGLAVREAARLHGQYWDAVDRPPLSGLYDCLNSASARILQTAYLICLPTALERFGSQFSSRMRLFAEALGPWIAAHFASVAADPRTLIHGDYRGENMFFRTGSTNGFAVIDWQGCGLGCGLYDVAYFMATSVPLEDRRRMERGALEEYHDIVCRMGAKSFAFEDCWRSYRQNMLGAILACILGCGGFDVTDPERRNLATALLSRTLAAIEDLDADEFLPARARFMSPGHGFSTLSRWGYGGYRLARRLRGKKAH